MTRIARINADKTMDEKKDDYLMFKGLYHELTESIIGIFFEVYNSLGYGFLEQVYENALAIALKRAGYEVAQQQAINVYFEGQVVGVYYADIIVNRKIVLELKTAKKIVDEHVAQLINYLRATDAQVGLVLNFGSKPDFKRRVFSNTNKSHRPEFLQENPRQSVSSASSASNSEIL